MPFGSTLERRADGGARDLRELVSSFPDDDACLEFLWRSLYSEDGEYAGCPRCATSRRFRRYNTRPQRKSWTCTACGYHLHPTVGTIFQGSATSLRAWFFAILLVMNTEGKLTARSLQRELGVTYKTAWRMLHLIREQVSERPSMPQFFVRPAPSHLAARHKSRRHGRPGAETAAGVRHRST